MGSCHTMDRENLHAFGECGENGFENETWKQAVAVRLQMETWAQQDQAECLNQLHPFSETQMRKTYYNETDVSYRGEYSLTGITGNQAAHLQVLAGAVGVLVAL